MQREQFFRPLRGTTGGVAGVCLSLVMLTSSVASAQAPSQPLADPTVDQLVRALGAASVSKAIEFRRTRMPDANHFCPEASGASVASAQAGSRRKDLEVIPYDAGHTASTELAINFAFGTDKLTAADQRLLDTLAKALDDPRLANGRFAVAGHTDAAGPVKINLELSCARALAVRSYLIAKGVSADRLSAYGFGSDRLLDPANPKADVNRRVEIRRDIDFKKN